jgi:hypothetical protein
VHNAAAVVDAGQCCPLEHAIWLDVLVHTLPTAHAAAAILADGQYSPDTHAPVTAERPVVAQYEPDVHGVGADMATDAHNAPAWHGTGATEASGQKVPAMQAPDSTDRPVRLQ